MTADNGGIMGTILVVDDTPANLILLVEVLTAEGYHVRPADSGPDLS
jgi:CheY-like chemotaxis protein